MLHLSGINSCIQDAYTNAPAPTPWCLIFMLDYMLIKTWTCDFVDAVVKKVWSFLVLQLSLLHLLLLHLLLLPRCCCCPCWPSSPLPWMIRLLLTSSRVVQIGYIASHSPNSISFKRKFYSYRISRISHCHHFSRGGDCDSSRCVSRTTRHAIQRFGSE